MTPGERHLASNRLLRQVARTVPSPVTRGARRSSSTGSRVSPVDDPDLEPRSSCRRLDLRNLPRSCSSSRPSSTRSSAARGQGAGDLLRAAGHRQDLRRAQARRGARAGPSAADDRPVPPVDVVRGLLRGLPARDQRRRRDDLRADAGPARAAWPSRRDGGAGRASTSWSSTRSTGRTCPRCSASCCSCSSTATSRSARSTGPTTPFELPPEPVVHRHDEHRRPLDRARRRRAAPPFPLRAVLPRARTDGGPARPVARAHDGEPTWVADARRAW